MAPPRLLTSAKERAEEITDAELVNRCIRGDQQAWDLLVKRYQRLIYSVSLAVCRESEVAADILQQVCLDLYQHLDEIRKVDDLRPWLVTVTRRKTASYLRSLKPTLPIVDEEQFVEPIDLVARVEQQHMLEQALKTLTARDRRLLELLSAGRSYEEIAAELQMPVASIGPTRIRCLNKLRTHLTK